jgi:hypothetical protein
VLNDYFAATRQELAAMDPDQGPAGNNWPYVDCKGWMLELAEFTAEIDGHDPDEFGQDELLGDAAEDQEHWLTRVNAELFDTLARLDPASIRAYGAAERLKDWEVERFLEVAALARAARAEGRELYSFSGL